MSKFTMHISTIVTIMDGDTMDGDTFTVEANSAEEAEEKCRELFKLRMWEKYGYADWERGKENIEHYCNDWEV